MISRVASTPLSTRMLHGMAGKPALACKLACKPPPFRRNTVRVACAGFPLSGSQVAAKLGSRTEKSILYGVVDSFERASSEITLPLSFDNTFLSLMLLKEALLLCRIASRIVDGYTEPSALDQSAMSSKNGRSRKERKAYGQQASVPWLWLQTDTSNLDIIHFVDIAPLHRIDAEQSGISLARVRDFSHSPRLFIEREISTMGLYAAGFGTLGLQFDLDCVKNQIDDYWRENTQPWMLEVRKKVIVEVLLGFEEDGAKQ